MCRLNHQHQPPHRYRVNPLFVNRDLLDVALVSSNSLLRIRTHHESALTVKSSDICHAVISKAVYMPIRYSAKGLFRGHRAPPLGCDESPESPSELPPSSVSDTFVK